MSELLYLSLSVINILLHSIGLYLLVTKYKSATNARGRSTQELLLINLSLSELIANSYAVVSWSLVLVVDFNMPYNYYLYPTMDLIDIFSFGSTLLCSWFAMFYITADRLASILLNIRYPVYWSASKTKILLLITWIICILIGTTYTILYHLFDEDLNFDATYDIYVFTLEYIPTVLYILYAVFAVVAYAVMFLHFARSRRSTIHAGREAQASLFEIFKNSNFFVSVLLISTYLILLVVPKVMSAIMMLNDLDLPLPHLVYFNVSVILSDTTDCVIYVFLQRDIRKLLFQKVCCGCCVNPETAIGTRQARTPQNAVDGENRGIQTLTTNQVESVPIQTLTTNKVDSVPMQTLTANQVDSAPMQTLTPHQVDSAPMQPLTANQVEYAPIQPMAGNQVEYAPIQPMAGNQDEGAPMQPLTANHLGSEPMQPY